MMNKENIKKLVIALILAIFFWETYTIVKMTNRSLQMLKETQEQLHNQNQYEEESNSDTTMVEIDSTYMEDYLK